MANEVEQIAQRKAKLEELVALGVPPYPVRFDRTATISEIVAAFTDTTGEVLEADKPQARVAGRILSIRSFGKANFLVLSDGLNRLQVYVRADSMPERDFEIFKRLDFGDHVGVSGRVFRTKTNELTIFAESIVFLAKCLLPLPEKWHGLTDVEIRYRQRYLDLIVNPAARKVFETRAARSPPCVDFINEPWVSRGRDADDAAHRRRRVGAALRDASQHARHAAVPAHRAGVVSEAADRGRL